MNTEVPPINVADGCETVFRQIVESCTQAIDCHLAVFLLSDHESGPHKTRVALRRLTTALDAFAPILRKSVRRDFRNEAKDIFRALGKVRDSDVTLARNGAVAGHSERASRNGKLREKTRAHLRKRKAVTFAPRLRNAVQSNGRIFGEKRKAQILRQTAIGVFAADALNQHWAECLGFGPSIRALAIEQRHDFRKAMKSARYLCEFFEPCFPAIGADPFLSDFRRLQNMLGILNDCEVARSLDKRIREMPRSDAESRAMAEAGQIWQRLRGTQMPWDQPTGAAQETRSP